MKGQHSPGMSSQSVIVVTGGVRCLRNGLGTVCHASVAALACNPAPILLRPSQTGAGLCKSELHPVVTSTWPVKLRQIARTVNCPSPWPGLTVFCTHAL